ncbi:MAG: CPBP family intramembrane metalloprotease [Planctomycetes bacterium]|nr:CPBP family intramembrane metalloprotease [Planctomycetota bacterium]
MGNSALTTLKHIALNPFLYLMLAIFFISAQVMTKYEMEFGETVGGLIVFGGLGLLMIPLTRFIKPHTIKITNPRSEALLWTTYFTLWLALNMLLWPSFFSTSGYLSNGLSFWFLLVIVPFIILWLKGSRWQNLGLSLKNFLPNLYVALIAGAIVVALLVFLTPGGRYIRSPEAQFWPITQGLAIAFCFSLLAAGFHEEFFFRAILQTRIARAFNSEVSGIALSTLMFGIYHLPFRFYQGAAEGDLNRALAICFTETILAAFILGILWARTRNLLAPVLVHTLIDTISGLPMIMDTFALSN